MAAKKQLRRVTRKRREKKLAKKTEQAPSILSEDAENVTLNGGGSVETEEPEETAEPSDTADTGEAEQSENPVETTEETTSDESEEQ